VRLLVGALVAIAPATAFAGQFCTDACTPDQGTGQSCADIGLGCNAISNACVVCSDNSHCQPGGTCSNGTCMGLVCTPDAGPTDADAALDAMTMDAEPMDAEPMDADAIDADPIDAAPVDTAFADAADPTSMLPGTRPMPNSKTDPFEEDDCGCTAARESGGSPLWILIAIGLVSRRYRKC
jgi:hypothetical protein